MPWTAALMWIATLAIAGVPPLSGFFSKDEILTAAHARGHADPIWLVFWSLALAAALLTAFYMTRLMLYTFHGPNRTGDKEQAHLHEAPWILTGPLLVLGCCPPRRRPDQPPRALSRQRVAPSLARAVTRPSAPLLPVVHL